jgi:hypothetical protein
MSHRLTAALVVATPCRKERREEGKKGRRNEEESDALPPLEPGVPPQLATTM